MRIVVVGAGPAGLYFSILMKKADPEHDITIYERNRADDTFGFGVVFSDETLGRFRAYDAETYERITSGFAYWDAIEVHAKGAVVRSGGHGFAGIYRVELLKILQERCADLGVTMRFESEVSDVEQFRDADLVLAADGINSAVRERYQEHFRPTFDWRKNKFVWLGTTKYFSSFLFSFRETPHGIFQLAAYSYDRGLATIVVEATEETWRRAKLDKASEADTLAFCQDVFADELDGHPLLANRSVWRTFPTIRNERWHHGNIALIGDALHTAHYSIGSGTKLAMEDAIALFDAFQSCPDDVDGALDRFEAERCLEVEITQRAADFSLVWFENVERYWRMEPMQLAFSLLSRSKQVTYENLKLRDAPYIDGVDRWWAGHVRASQGFDVPLEPARPPMFTPFRLRDMVVDNRVVVSPMDQYCAVDGVPGEWHLVHLGGLARGGAGLVITEMTCVSAEGRITLGCTGIYAPEHVAAWKRIVDFVHAHSRARIALQLGHCGRKGSTGLGWEGADEPLAHGNWPVYSASPVPYTPRHQVPIEMDRAKMREVREAFVAAAEMAEAAGFDALELHCAHGYLLSSFLSPLTNGRGDRYGGTPANRLRYPLEVLEAVREAWPAHKPISVRISATDWAEGGLGGDDSVRIATALAAHGCDIVHVSAGQTTIEAQPLYGRMFQTPFADQIRNEAGIPTIAVGNITSPDQINTIIAAGRADLCALGRPHLTDPHFTLRAAAHYGYADQVWPNPYIPARDQALRLAARSADAESASRAAADSGAPATPRRAAE